MYTSLTSVVSVTYGPQPRVKDSRGVRDGFPLGSWLLNQRFKLNHGLETRNVASTNKNNTPCWLSVLITLAILDLSSWIRAWPPLEVSHIHFFKQISHSLQMWMESTMSPSQKILFWNSILTRQRMVLETTVYPQSSCFILSSCWWVVTDYLWVVFGEQGWRTRKLWVLQN